MVTFNFLVYKVKISVKKIIFITSNDFHLILNAHFGMISVFVCATWHHKTQLVFFWNQNNAFCSSVKMCASLDTAKSFTSVTNFPRPNADFPPPPPLNSKFLKVWVSSHLSNLSASSGSSQSLDTWKSSTLPNNNIFQMRNWKRCCGGLS